MQQQIWGEVADFCTSSQNAKVKELLTLVYICQSCHKNKSGIFLQLTAYCYSYYYYDWDNYDCDHHNYFGLLLIA